MSGRSPIATAPHFGDRLTLRIRELGHPLCVGLDPHLERIPRLFRRGSMRPADPRTAPAVESFLRAIVDRVAGRVAVVKPQIAFFEQLGPPGFTALAAIVEHCRRHRLLVILDAKRGDIGSTARAYAAAYLGPAAPLPADAVTVNPYLGVETLLPFIEEAKATGRGLFVLVKTSNPGSGDFQDRSLDGGGRLFEAVAASLAPIADALEGGETGWSSLGVVVAATFPEEAVRVRHLLPRALFLIPGFGAQGAGVGDAVRGLIAGPGGVLEGGLVSSSRALLYPPDGDTDRPPEWERAIDGAVDRAVEELRSVGSSA